MATHPSLPHGFQPTLSHPGVVFTPNDPAFVEVSGKTQTVQGVRLYAKSLDSGAPVIQARLGSAAGPVIAQQEVDEFTLASAGVSPRAGSPPTRRCLATSSSVRSH